MTETLRHSQVRDTKWPEAYPYDIDTFETIMDKALEEAPHNDPGILCLPQASASLKKREGRALQVLWTPNHASGSKRRRAGVESRNEDRKKKKKEEEIKKKKRKGTEKKGKKQKKQKKEKKKVGKKQKQKKEKKKKQKKQKKQKKHESSKRARKEQFR
jgi:outer membrane biosynthesis protein TonB